MAASIALKQVDGNEVRSCMAAVDLDGVDVAGIGSTLGMTVVSALKGVEVDASAALLYTSVAAMNNHDFMVAATNYMTAQMVGVDVMPARNAFDQYIVNFEGINTKADEVDISLPVLSIV